MLLVLCLSAIRGGLARFHTFRLKFIIVQGFRRHHLHSELVAVASRIVKTATRERFYVLSKVNRGSIQGYCGIQNPQSSDFTMRRLSLLACIRCFTAAEPNVTFGPFLTFTVDFPHFRKCPPKFSAIISIAAAISHTYAILRSLIIWRESCPRHTNWGPSCLCQKPPAFVITSKGSQLRKEYNTALLFPTLFRRGQHERWFIALEFAQK